MNSLSRRQFMLNTALATVGTLSSSKNSYASEEQWKPNIIFIMADDLGYGDLGCYGQKVIQTPNLDQMASEGMRFTDCYAGSTVCAPSRCCLMTGYHTGHAIIRGNGGIPLLPENVTVAEILKNAGYTTGIIGKWGLGEAESTGIPNRQGFDYWFGYLNQRRAHNYWPDYVWKNEERFFFKRWTYTHDAFTKEAVNFIEENQNNPFFLYLPYTIPHAFNEGGNQGMQVPNDAPYSKEPWPQQSKNHAAMITRMDKDIGKIFELLNKLNLDENTIVFFTSDNGPHREGGADPHFFDSNGLMRGIKRDLYEGGICVPMIVRWPGRIKANTVNDHPWAFWDFLPTAAELAGTQSPVDIDGISVLPTLLGKTQKGHDYFYWEFHERGFHQAVRMGEWKGVRNQLDHPIELYNLKKDRSETKNIAEVHPDIVTKIEEIMKSARNESEHWPIRRRRR